MDRDMWKKLIRGKTITVKNVQFFLKDIGLMIMQDDLDEAWREYKSG